jgi:hypothetical protein
MEVILEAVIVVREIISIAHQRAMNAPQVTAFQEIIAGTTTHTTGTEITMGATHP